MEWYLLLPKEINSSEMELLSVDGEGTISCVVVYHNESRGGGLLGVKKSGCKKNWREKTRLGDQNGCLAGVPSKTILFPCLRNVLTTGMHVAENKFVFIPESEP